jgi:hypothetical protein
MRTRLLMTYVTLTSLAIASAAPASTITWDAVQNISGGSDMSKLGTLDRAYVFDGVAGNIVVVNGVTFTEFADQGWDTATFTAHGAHTFAPESMVPPYSSLSAGYQQIVKSGTWSDSTTASLTLTKLTQGTVYQVQVWVNDSRMTYGYSRTETVSGSGVMTYNTGNLPEYSEGGLGQYVIGTFKADTTSETLDFSANGNYVQLEGIQLRVVPEPSAIVLVASALVGLLAYAWRKRR